MTITLAGSQDCADDEAPCTSDGRTTEHHLATLVAGPLVPTRLTAQFTNLPTEYAGSGTFEVWVAFSHDLRNSYTHLHEHPTVTGGELEGSSRVDGRSDLWKFVIEPDGDGPVTFAMASAAQCDDTSVDEVPCTQQGKPLSNDLSTTIQEPALISVQGASADEGGNLTFTVSLSRAATETITVDYATSDAAATAGTDYTAASGTLTFLPTQHTKDVTVSTLDDAAEEETETLTLTLSNPSIGRIVDAMATGSIEDDDATVSEQTVREDVTDLGDITGTGSTTYSSLQTLDGEYETRDWFTFTLTASKRVQLGLRQLDADATLTLEDQDGGTVQTKSGTRVSTVRFSQTLQAGTYYVRVDADQVAQNDYKLSWKAS